MSSASGEDGTGRVHLTMALNPVDHVRDLMDGNVRVDGVSLTALALPVEEIFYRFTAFQEWDVSEMSFAKYAALASGADAPMIGLPVFTSRMFRHSSIYVRKGSGLESPSDLEGCVVGVPEWAQTAGVWVRGMLAETYGVDLRKIRWVQSGVNQFGRREKVDLNLPAGIDYSAHPDRSLDALLEAGEIDAVISARPPACFGRGGAERMFPDFRTAEADYYRNTGIFPIMHLVVLKRRSFDRHPWIAQNLVKGFEDALDRSMTRTTDITASPLPIAWATSFAEEVTQLFNGDPWPAGFDRNRTTIETFLRFAFEQGVTRRKLTAAEIFPRETQSSVRV